MCDVLRRNGLELRPLREELRPVVDPDRPRGLFDRVAERADYVPVWAEGVSFYEQASVLADFDESDRWTADFEAGIDIPMFAGLSTTLKAVVAHNHMPAEGKEKTDRRLLAQVGYNF